MRTLASVLTLVMTINSFTLYAGTRAQNGKATASESENKKAPEMPSAEQQPKQEAQKSTFTDSGNMYGMVMSMGNGPNDRDILVVRNKGRLYSFKYCKAYVNQQPVREILELRRDFFLNPHRYEMHGENEAILEGFFKSPFCKTVGAESYGLTKDAAQWGNVPDSSFSLIAGIGSVAFAFVSQFGGRIALHEFRRARAQQNTKTLLRFIFSSRFPKGSTATFLATLGISVYAGRFAYEEWHDGKDGRTLYEASAKVISPGNPAVVLQNSMDDFLRDFSAGLQVAVKNKLFIEL